MDATRMHEAMLALRTACFYPVPPAEPWKRWCCKSLSVALSLWSLHHVTACQSAAQEAGISSAATAESNPHGQDKLREYAAELDIGRNMAGRILQNFSYVKDEELTTYVATVGQVVASHSPFGERPFVFGVLDTDLINAFAMPGGYIFVTRGALASMQSEAELAAVLGHEIAHIGNRHIYKAVLTEAAGTRSSQQPDSLGRASMQARARPKSTTSETAATLAAVIGGGSASSLNIITVVKNGLGLLLDKGLEPALEYEADRQGVDFAMASGYDPFALVSYFERLLLQQQGKQTALLSKTHPSMASRIKVLKTYYADSVPTEYAGALGSARFSRNVTSRI